MKRILTCRRTSVALVSIVCLTFLGWTGADPEAVAGAIAAISIGLSAANASERFSAKGKDSGLTESAPGGNIRGAG